MTSSSATGKPERRTPARRSAPQRSATAAAAPPEARDEPHSPARECTARRRPRPGGARGGQGQHRGQAQGGRPDAGRRAAAGPGNLRRRRWSGSGPDPRDPQPLGATLRTWIASAGAGADLKKATLFARWEKIVGPEVADHCSPVTLVDGELLVEAESTAWATQIRMLAPQLLRKINAEVGDRTVVRIRARGPAGPSWKFGYRHVSGRGPRDTYG